MCIRGWNSFCLGSLISATNNHTFYDSAKLKDYTILINRSSCFDPYTSSLISLRSTRIHLTSEPKVYSQALISYQSCRSGSFDLLFAKTCTAQIKAAASINTLKTQSSTKHSHSIQHQSLRITPRLQSATNPVEAGASTYFSQKPVLRRSKLLLRLILYKRNPILSTRIQSIFRT
jgi:hypothetical protein